MHEKLLYGDWVSDTEDNVRLPMDSQGMVKRDECIFKKCCKKYKKKGKHCRRCPKL